MPVTERHMGGGNFQVQFNQEFTPTAIIEAVTEWGHIIITPQEIDIKTLTDSEIKNLSSYTGIVLNRVLEEGVISIAGASLELYLGDGAGKGMVIAESNNVGKVRHYTGTTLAETLFNSTAQTNKPLGIMRDEAGNTQAITQGTISEPASTYTGSHFVETAGSALKFVSETLGTEYRVNPNGTIDAGPAANLFEGVGTATPKAIVVKTAYGQDPSMEGVVPQGLKTEFDAQDFVSRVDFTGEVGFFDIATDVAGEANISSNPYKDLHGNALKRVALVQEPDIAADQLNARAQTLLNELSRVKKVLNLDLEQYEVSGDMKVGDFIFAFDPDIEFVDTAADATAESRSLNEITFRGQDINPVKVRVKGITYPIRTGMGVYFRDKDGNYTDLSQYALFEQGGAQIELGDTMRSIQDDLRFSEFSLTSKTAGAFSIPDLPSTPTLQAGSYLDGTGISKGFIRVVVSKPTNEDGSQITDGQSYGVRYKKTTDSQYSFVYFPYTGAATESLLIQDLTIGATYQVGVNVIDKSGFKKMSAYDGSGEDLYTDSSSVNPNFATNARIEIDKDGQAPSKPKQATAIATGPLKVQITHHLGKDGTDGNGNPFGNFTLEGDIDYLAVHAVTQSGNSANFTVSTSNKIGEIRVTAGNLLQQIPLVGSADLADSSGHYFRFVAVDKSGNASDPSDGQTASADLIEESHIADATITTAKIGTAQITNALIADATIDSAKIANLNAGKINAGTISADRIGADSITAAKIASNTITAAEIAADTITASQIASGTITASEIASNTITTNQINFTPYTSGQAITNGSVGGISISSSALQSSNFSQGSAGFQIKNDGTAEFQSITVRGNFSGTVDGATQVTNNIFYGSGGSMNTAGSGVARVEIGNTSPNEVRFLNSSNQTLGTVESDGADMLLTASLSTTANTKVVAGIAGDVILQGGDINFTSGLGTSPIIKVEGSGGNNKFLATNGSGRLILTGNTSSSGVDSITASGELSLAGAGTGNVTITHAASDHNSENDSRYYSASAGATLASSLSSHTGHATSLSILSNTSSNNSGGLFVTAVSGLGIQRTNIAGATMDTQEVRPRQDQAYAVGEAGRRYTIGYFQFGTSTSDQRLKENIEDLDLGLDFINKLEPKKYNWTTETITDDEGNEIIKRGDIADIDMFGFMAQDVLAIDDLDDNITYGIARHNEVEDTYDLSYENMIAPLVKAVQELSTQVNDLTARIEVLEGG